LRYIVKFAYEHIIGGSQLDYFVIETGAGIRKAYLTTWAGAVKSVRLSMGIPFSLTLPGSK